MLKIRFLINLTSAAIVLTHTGLSAAEYIVTPGGSFVKTAGLAKNPGSLSEIQIGLIAGAGDTVTYSAGTYAPILLSGKKGTASAPLVYRAAAGAQVILTGDSYSSGYGIKLVECSYVIVEGFVARRNLWGFYIDHCDHVTIRKCTAEDLGQEAIHATNASSFIEILDNTISNTGNRNSAWGEGIYIGHGNNYTADHDILIKGNVISNTTSEGIDVKARTYNVTIEDNIIHDTRSYCCGVIVIAYNAESHADPKHIVRRNRIYNARPGAYNSGAVGILIGAGCTVYNNVVYNCDSYGIHVRASSFTAPKHFVGIYNNTVYNCNGDIRIETSSNADVDARNNIGLNTSGNIASSAGLFADASGGNFHLNSTASAAIDKGVAIPVVGTDYDNLTRPVGGAYDMGAFEYSAGATGTAYGLPGDTRPGLHLRNTRSKHADALYMDIRGRMRTIMHADGMVIKVSPAAGRCERSLEAVLR